MKSQKSLERKIEILSKMLASFEKKLSKTNSKIDDLASVIAKGALSGMDSSVSNRSLSIRAKTERFGERNEQLERTLNMANLNNVRGRHREILVLLINGGFHTYKQIATKLNVSQSRVRAYIAELKNKYEIPLTQMRDAEGYKVGIELRFVEQILQNK